MQLDFVHAQGRIISCYKFATKMSKLNWLTVLPFVAPTQNIAHLLEKNTVGIIA